MEVEAHVWYWTKDGMREIAETPNRVGYIEKREVERMLEEAHTRGHRLALEAAMQVVRDAGYHVS